MTSAMVHAFIGGFICGFASLAVIITLALRAAGRVELAVENGCPDEVEPMGEGAPAEPVDMPGEAPPVMASREPRPEEIAAARTVVKEGGCASVHCGDCPYLCDGPASGTIENNPLVVEAARAWLASHGIPVEEAEGFDMNQCKPGDRLISKHGAVCIYLDKKGPAKWPHRIRFVDDKLGEGSRTDDGHVFARHRIPEDHDIIGFAPVEEAAS